MKKLLQVLLTVLIGALLFNTISCSDDEGATAPPPSPEETILTIVVKSSLDSSLIENSNVVVYEAENGQAITRNMTDTNGECGFELDQGNYYLGITAQNYDPSPAPNTTPVPFFVMEEDTTTQTIYLNENPIADSGQIQGYVDPATNNFLILAGSSDLSEKYSTVTGPDGFFIIYNLPYDTYSFEALKKGYKMDGVVNSTIDAVNQTDSVTILVSDYVGSSLSGTLSFIAGAVAKPTDMVLRDSISLDIIPEMVTLTDDGNGYIFDNIPDGNFILWASLENDSNVMDPDKNLGGIDVSFPADDGNINNIDITGAILITSPTNPPDSIYAYMADSQNPIFSWELASSYSSRKEWIIEVRDINGNKIWGGFDEAGVIQHPQIPAANVTFEYPVTAPDLQPGQVYQWKIYADNNADPNVQGLLSSSEDLMGIFQVPEPVK